ncbi:MAG: hypothetical protein BroJett021_29150 [Chloroflexota bacterium]|nr:MAG: hypothetical protein BroJett021_29150 [Chloroflexota bacterium]
MQANFRVIHRLYGFPETLIPPDSDYQRLPCQPLQYLSFLKRQSLLNVAGAYTCNRTQ